MGVVGCQSNVTEMTDLLYSGSSQSGGRDPHLGVQSCRMNFCFGVFCICAAVGEKAPICDFISFVVEWQFCRVCNKVQWSFDTASVNVGVSNTILSHLQKGGAAERVYQLVSSLFLEVVEISCIKKNLYFT